MKDMEFIVTPLVQPDIVSPQLFHGEVRLKRGPSTLHLSLFFLPRFVAIEASEAGLKRQLQRQMMDAVERTYRSYMATTRGLPTANL